MCKGSISILKIIILGFNQCLQVSILKITFKIKIYFTRAQGKTIEPVLDWMNIKVYALD